MDKRKERVQPVRLSSEFFPLDIHKSMFINDLLITIPTYYVKTWGNDLIEEHNQFNNSWETTIIYETPKFLGKNKLSFKAKISLASIKGRNKVSNYRLKWDNEFAIQLAKDYPKSFVRALEFHIGDEHYKNLKYTEFDIGGFKEQLQVRITWDRNIPTINIKEYFRVRDEFQIFPFVFKELSSYLIADYLLSSEEELLRRIQITEWKEKAEISKELFENIIYLLLNRDEKKIYFGETKQSLSKRYPVSQQHHSFVDWTEYSIIHLPPEIPDHTRVLIERVIIAIGAKLFPNELYSELPILAGIDNFKLVNKKK